MRSMAKDPVCGMYVDESKPKYTHQHAGVTYYFCSPACKASFEKNPARYVR